MGVEPVIAILVRQNGHETWCGVRRVNAPLGQLSDGQRAGASNASVLVP